MIFLINISYYLKFFLCISAIIYAEAHLHVNSSDGLILSTQMGKILGTTMMTDRGRKIYAFKGIPFAQPPIGNLRFRPPLPPDPWIGIFDGRADSTSCLQPAILSNSVIGKEDCLVLQIYTPKIQNSFNICKGLLPVMVFIHGGYYLIGSGSMTFYGPQKLLEEDIVLININYRLGVIGFLSTGDKEAYGNYGLLDQVQALKWIKKNIADYCGDPDRVTIFGESAGATSVIHLLLSPAAEGLFHGVIAQSGTALMPDLLQRRPAAQTIALAKELNCPFNLSNETISCLRNKSGKTLIEGAISLSFWKGFPPPFLPVIETPHEGAFQTEEMEILAKRGTFNRVPVIAGFNRDEAATFYAPLLLYLEDGVYETGYIDKLFEFLRNYTRFRSPEAEAKIREEYFKGINLSNENSFRQRFIEVFSDAIFKAPIRKTVYFISRFVPTYMYSFGYRGHYWIGDFTLNLHDNTSVGHADDILYIFKGMGRLKASDTVVSQFFIELWTNFARTQNPTPEGIPLRWEPVSKGQFKFLKISNKLEMISKVYLSEKMKFWEKMIKYEDKRSDSHFLDFNKENNTNNEIFHQQSTNLTNRLNMSSCILCSSLFLLQLLIIYYKANN